MKHLFAVLLLLGIAVSSFAQFSDTAELKTYIRDTLKDRRPSKVTIGQIQKGMLGIVDAIPLTPELPDRVFKIYSRDYNDDTIKYDLVGWETEYNGDPTYAHPIVSTIDIEITLQPGTPSGTVVTAIFDGYPVYTLTLTGTLIDEAYVIGTVKVNQDIKYETMFYVKGAAETINAAGVVNTTNTAFRITDSFTNPPLWFAVADAGTMVRIGSTYMIDKKKNGAWFY